MGSGPIIWDGSFYSTIYYKKGKIKGNEGSFFLYQKVMKGKRIFFFFWGSKKKKEEEDNKEEDGEVEWSRESG